MRKYIVLYCLIVLFVPAAGQTVEENISGKVSFISSQNIYVRFRTTEGISAGDTLFISSGNRLVPVLKVNSLSSVSCVCSPISEAVLPLDHLIIAKSRTKVPVLVEEATVKPLKDTASVGGQSGSSDSISVSKEIKQRIRGSISVISYSDISGNDAANSQRFRYTLSLDVKNIADSRFSFKSYISFRHRIGEGESIKSDLFSALKIYDFSIRYDLNKTTSFTIGRRINPRISGMGALDGLQFEKSFKGFTLGAVAGLRPDYTNYGINPDLFQYGGFLAYSTGSAGKFTESSVAFMQQMNKSSTDRRFLYFQHSNTLLKNTYFLGTFEADLYKLENNVPRSTFDITSIYVSLRYNPIKSVSVTGTYDARKNVIFYETYKTFTDRLLENQIRQGFRLNTNVRITKKMMAGAQGGYRFLKSDPHPSRNLHGYLTYRVIPVVNMSATISGTLLESGFMNGIIGGLNLSRDFLSGKVQTGLGYHYIDYRLPENSLDIRQHMGEINFSLQLFEKTSLSAYWEGTFETKNTWNRIYLQVRKRF